MRRNRLAGVGHRRALAATVTAAVLVPAAAAAQASAATLSMSSRCYVITDQPAQIDVLGNGFTPGDTIQISGRGVAGSTVAGPDGSINLITNGPSLPFSGPGQKTYTLQAHDETAHSGLLGSTSVTLANLSVATVPGTAAPSSKVTWHFSGFLPGKTIFIHYLHGGKVQARTAFGKAQGPCGTLRARARLYPDGNPRFGTYQVVFDQVRRYSRRARPRILTSVNFF